MNVVAAIEVAILAMFLGCCDWFQAFFGCIINKLQEDTLIFGFKKDLVDL